MCWPHDVSRVQDDRRPRQCAAMPLKRPVPNCVPLLVDDPCGLVYCRPIGNWGPKYFDDPGSYLRHITD